MTVPKCRCHPGALLMCDTCRRDYYRELTARRRPSWWARFTRWLVG